MFPTLRSKLIPIIYGIKKGNAGIDKAKPGTVNVSLKNADKITIERANKLNSV
jgi:hypothetical protein